MVCCLTNPDSAGEGPTLGEFLGFVDGKVLGLVLGRLLGWAKKAVDCLAVVGGLLGDAEGNKEAQQMRSFLR